MASNPYAFLPEYMNELPGYPGYRNRTGRCGLDPLDRNNELGHMAGVFVRQLFFPRWTRIRFRWRTFTWLMVGFALLLNIPYGILIIPIIVCIQFCRLLYVLFMNLRNRL